MGHNCQGLETGVKKKKEKKKKEKRKKEKKKKEKTRERNEKEAGGTGTVVNRERFENTNELSVGKRGVA